MTSQNKEAEELMGMIEQEEEYIVLEDDTKHIYHLCIVNLVIGTLYCSKVIIMDYKRETMNLEYLELLKVWSHLIKR